jgi:hypothetical protein
MDRFDNPRMRSASANIALQGLSDLDRTRSGICRKKANAAQDHPRLAVGTLKGTCIQKCLLHRMQVPVLLEAFDSCDGF